METLCLIKFYTITMEALGWLGTIAYLLSYFLISTDRITSSERLFHLLNIAGAIGLTCNAFYLTDYPNIAVNLAWAAIAASAIYRNSR
jgi:hypothetical protein